MNLCFKSLEFKKIIIIDTGYLLSTSSCASVQICRGKYILHKEREIERTIEKGGGIGYRIKIGIWFL